MKPKPKRKRKPRLEGWIVGRPDMEPWVSTSDGMIQVSGTKNLKAIGKFFIAAAEYFEGRGK
jgi:hypothetical protein